MLSLVRELYDHMRWADAAVWRTALATPAAADDGVLRDRFVHIHTVQRAFLSVWRGEVPQFRERHATLADVARWGRDYHDAVLAHLASAGDAALEQVVKLPWADRLSERFGRASAAPTTLRDTMLQVPLHSTYHRGQVNTRLRELGAEPPLVDYIAWIWSGKPAAEWPGGER